MASSGTEEGRAGENIEQNAGAPEPAEVAIRRLELQFELQKMQLQLQVMQLESQERIALRRAELEMADGGRTPSISDTGERGRSGLDNVTQCSKVLKGLKLPCDADVPLWFDEVERVFSTYNVPLESRVHLVMPALTERVRYLLRGLSEDECGDYDAVKAAVLNELKLTPSEYLDRFETAAKRKDETWAQFASRVGTYFEYYLRSREKAEKRARAQKVQAAEPGIDGTLLEDEESKALVARVNSPLSSGGVRKSKLQEIELECAGRPIVAILDTGSEVTIVKESLLPAAVQEPSGKIKLVSAFGDAVEAKLVSLSFSLRDTAFVNAPEVVQIVCAITDKLTDADCLLSKEDWELLADIRKYVEPAWAAVGVKKNPEGASVTAPKQSEPDVRGEAPGERYARVNETHSDEATASELPPPREGG
ncbi:hypothetical protein MTO96_045268 [Rhipicephalus appendiculatus]